jgi:hypothetical protein
MGVMTIYRRGKDNEPASHGGLGVICDVIRAHTSVFLSGPLAKKALYCDTDSVFYIQRMDESMWGPIGRYDGRTETGGVKQRVCKCRSQELRL